MPFLNNILGIKENNFPFIILRVTLGISFIFSAYDKIARGIKSGDLWGGYSPSLEFILGTHWKEQAFGFYQPFLDSVVIPNVRFFAGLVTWGELAIGISLVLGLFSRLGAVAAIFINFNIYLAYGGSFLFYKNPDVGFILIAMTIFIAAAGRMAGLDSILVKKFGVPSGAKGLIY